MTEQRNEAYELVVAQQQTEIESLRAQLAEERQQKHEALHREYCRREELERKLAEVSAELEIAKGTAAALEREFDNHTATQAHAARLVEALNSIRNFSMSHYVVSTAEAALSTRINLDALYEHDAHVLEEAVTLINVIDDGEASEYRACQEAIRELAATRRAKKEGK